MRCRNENLEISCGIAADNEPLDADGSTPPERQEGEDSQNNGSDTKA